MALRVTRQAIEALGIGTGALRITRQSVDALGTGVGALRVTRQSIDALVTGQSNVLLTRVYAEILGKVPPTGDAFQTINVNQSLNVIGRYSYAGTSTFVTSQRCDSNIKDCIAQNNIVFSETARQPIFRAASTQVLTPTCSSLGWNLTQHITQALTLTQVTSQRNLNQHTLQSLAISQDCEAVNQHSAATNSLTLTQICNYNIPGRRVYGTQTLVVTQTGVYTLVHYHTPVVYTKVASQTLVITQTARQSLLRLTAQQSIPIFGFVGYVGPQWLYAIDHLEPLQGYTNQAYLCQKFSALATSPVSFIETVNCLQNPQRLTISQTVVLVDEADNSAKYRSLTDPINLTQTAVYDKIYTAISQLNVTQLLEQGIYYKSAFNQILVTDQARNKIFTLNANSTNFLQQQLRSTMQWGRFLDIIDIAQNVDVIMPKHVSALSALSYTEMVWDEENNVYVPYLRGLAQTVDIQAVTNHQAASKIFWAIDTQVIHAKITGTSISAENVLSISDQVWNSLTPVAADILIDLEHTVEVWHSNKIFEDLVALAQVASFNINRNLQALDQLDFIHGMGVVTVGDWHCEYHPFIGGPLVPGYGVPLQNPPPMPGGPYPTADGAGRGVIFFYPFTNPTTIWTTKRSPSFGDKVQFMAQRINRETRGGRKIIFADQQWPTEFKRVMGFNGLTETECKTWQVFIQNTLGREIGYTDNNGRIFKGVITNVQDPMTRNGKIDNAITVEFIVTAKSLPLTASNELQINLSCGVV